MNAGTPMVNTCASAAVGGFCNGSIRVRGAGVGAAHADGVRADVAPAEGAVVPFIRVVIIDDGGGAINRVSVGAAYAEVMCASVPCATGSVSGAIGDDSGDANIGVGVGAARAGSASARAPDVGRTVGGVRGGDSGDADVSATVGAHENVDTFRGA